MDFADRVSVLGSVKSKSFVEWKRELRIALNFKDPKLWWALTGELDSKVRKPVLPIEDDNGTPDPAQARQYAISLQEREQLLEEIGLKAIGHLGTVLPTGAQALLDNETDPAKAWKTVEKKFAQVYRKDPYEVWHRRDNFCQAPNERASTFIMRFHKLVAELEEISTYRRLPGRSFTSQDKLELFVESLNDSYREIGTLASISLTHAEKKDPPLRSGPEYDSLMEKNIQYLIEELIRREQNRRRQERRHREEKINGGGSNNTSRA